MGRVGARAARSRRRARRRCALRSRCRTRARSARPCPTRDARRARRRRLPRASSRTRRSSRCARAALGRTRSGSDVRRSIWGEGRLIGNADFSPTGRSLDAVRAHVAVGNFDFEALARDPRGPRAARHVVRRSRRRVALGRAALRSVGALDASTRCSASRRSGSRASREATAARSTARASRRLASPARRTRRRSASRARRRAGPTAPRARTSSATRPRSSVGGTDISAYAAAGHVAKTFSEVSLTPTLPHRRLVRLGRRRERHVSPVRSAARRSAALPRADGPLRVVERARRRRVARRSCRGRTRRSRSSTGTRGSPRPRASGSAAISPRSVARLRRPGYAAAGYAPITGSPDAELGHELDAVFTWRPWLPLELRAGWSGLLLGDGARRHHVRVRARQRRRRGRRDREQVRAVRVRASHAHDALNAVRARRLLAVPAAVLADVGVHEPVAARACRRRRRPPSRGRGSPSRGRAGRGPVSRLPGTMRKSHGVAERVLAVRGDVVALLSHRLVQLRAAVAAHELDARRRGASARATGGARAGAGRTRVARR